MSVLHVLLTQDLLYTLNECTNGWMEVKVIIIITFLPQHA